MAEKADSATVTQEERRNLQRIARSGSEPARARSRATIILLSAEGLGAQSISRTLGIGKRTVRETRRRWRRMAFEGLYDEARTGRPPRADRTYLRLLRRTVRTDPRTLGYCFAHWTAPRLAEYLRRVSGVGLCEDRVRILLNGMGFVWRRTKLTIRNLQQTRGKKAGPETALEAAAGRLATGGTVRALVRGRSSIRSSARGHLRLSSARQAASH